MKNAFLMTAAAAALVAGGGLASAQGVNEHHDPPAAASPQRTSAITCDTVRAYVSQIGLAQARAMARANGMTMAQESRARQCLATRD